MASSDPADRHRRIAGTFRERADATTDWRAPSPVPAWTAGDVVAHLVEWFPPFLAAGAGIELPTGPEVADDPAGAWRAQADAVQAILDDPASGERTFEHPHVPATPLPGAIDRFYTTDVFLHTWDLARATRQDDQLDPDECAALLAGMEPLDDLLRASGQYGPKVPAAPDADPQTRLLAFIGRNPAWHPPRR